MLQDRILDIQGRVSSLVDKLNAKRQERKDSMTTGKDVFNIQRSMRRLRHQVEQNLKCLVAQEAEVEAAAAAGNGEHAQQPAQTDDGTTHQAAQPSQQPGTEATSSDPQTSSTGAVVMIGGRYDLDSICSGTLPWGDGGSTGSFQLWLQHALTVAEQQRCSEQRVILRAKAANTVRLYEHQLQVMRYICKRAQAEACSMLQEINSLNQSIAPDHRNTIDRFVEGCNLQVTHASKAWAMAERIVRAEHQLQWAVNMFKEHGWDNL